MYNINKMYLQIPTNVPVVRVKMAALARTQLTYTVALATMDTRAPTVELVCYYKKCLPYKTIIKKCIIEKIQQKILSTWESTHTNYFGQVDLATCVGHVCNA